MAPYDVRLTLRCVCGTKGGLLGRERDELSERQQVMRTSQTRVAGTSPATTPVRDFNAIGRALTAADTAFPHRPRALEIGIPPAGDQLALFRLQEIDRPADGDGLGLQSGVDLRVNGTVDRRHDVGANADIAVPA